jgi:glyoxylase-like metal-dependent hydrolase (beta-lactamase superfamily II)
MEIINVGDFTVNNFIIKTSKGYIVVDTGYAGNYNRFCKKLKEHRISLDEIKFIFITHAHDDHVGFLNELIRTTDATLIMHSESPKRLLTGHNKNDGGYPNLLAKFFFVIMSLLGKGKHEFPVVKVDNDTLLWNGENQFFKEMGIDLEIISLPGHTSDLIGLLTDGSILLCGDASMNGFPSLKRNIIWIENLEDYKKSWKRMIESSAREIYPSHGPPFPKKDLIKYRDYLEKMNQSKMFN